jgi:adenosylhomocysteine nucleosidase
MTPPPRKPESSADFAASIGPAPADDLQPCHLGIVFAMAIEAGCFEDLLQGVVTIRGQGFSAREGGLNGQRVVVVVSGPGRQNAAHATELLIDGHRPDRVISAGLAGGLSAPLYRNDLVFADRVMQASGGEIAIEPPDALAAATGKPGVHRGGLLTLDRVVRLASEKRSLFDACGALAVDMETFAVAEVCRRRQVAFSAIRVINDTADEELPRDVEHLLKQRSGAARLGAALAAVWRRPGSAKDMYQMRENCLVASDRLAKFLAREACP